MIARYVGRVSGPLLDRIDMHVEVPELSYPQMSGDEPGEPSRAILERVTGARVLQHRRNGGGTPNARMPAVLLRRHCALDDAGRALMERCVMRLGLSVRSHDRILRVSRTIADLAGSDRIEQDHVREAIQYRELDRSMEGR